jgi:hypothetical protein
MLTGHGLLLRGLVSIPSSTGYVKGVQLYDDVSNQFVASSNVHREAMLLLCGSAALSRLEGSKKMTVSAWATSGARIQFIRRPCSELGHLHDWTDIEPRRPAAFSRAAYYEDATGQYFLRMPGSFQPGEVATDANTLPFTEGDVVAKTTCERLYTFGPLPIDWSARGCLPREARSDYMFSDCAEDLSIEGLRKKVVVKFILKI